METLTDRITRYLLSRIHRLAVLDLYERAAGVGLLEQAFIIEGDEQSGTVWRVPEHSLHLLRSEPVKLHAELGRRLRRATYKTPTFDVHGQDFAKPAVRNVRSSATRRCKQDTSATARLEASVPACRHEFLTQLKKHIAPPSVAHVAISETQGLSS